MAWTTPKVNWTTADGVSYVDLNRIESDISFIADNPTGTLLRLGEGSRNVAIGARTIDAGVSLVVADGVGGLPSILTGTTGIYQNNSMPGDTVRLSLISANDGICYIDLGDSASQNDGSFTYSNVDGFLSVTTRGAEVARWTSTGHFLLGTTADEATMHINGTIKVSGTSWNISTSAEGNSLAFSRDSANYIWSNTIGGYLALGTNGDTQNLANSNLVLNTNKTSSFKDKVFVESGGIEVTGTTDDVIIDSTGLLKVNRISESTASAGVTLNHELHVNTISERTASAGVTFSSEVKYKYYYSATTVTYVDIYNELATKLTTIGDVLILDGYIITATYKYRVFSVTRFNATTLYVKVNRGNTSSQTIDTLYMSTAHTTPVSSVKLTSNYDKV